MSDPHTPSTGTVPLSPPRGEDQLLPLGSSGVTVEHVDRKLTMYRVTEEELFTLRGLGPTLSLAFFGIMVGASFTLYTTLQGSSLERDTRHDLNSMYIGARWLAVFFALFAAVAYLRLWWVIRRIRKHRKVRVDGLTT